MTDGKSDPVRETKGWWEALRSRLMLGGRHGGAVKGAILACRRIQGFCYCYSVVLIHTGHPKALKALKAPKAHNLLRSRYSSPQGSTSCQGQAALVQNLKAGSSFVYGPEPHSRANFHV